MKNTFFSFLLLAFMLTISIPAESQSMIFSSRQHQLKKQPFDTSSPLKELDEEEKAIEAIEDKAAKQSAPRYVVDDNETTPNTQEISQVLKTFYEKKEYKKAITYSQQFEEINDGLAFVILGDCYMKESENEEQQFKKLQVQSMNNQMMAISQGLILDETPTLIFIQKIQEEILALKLQAVDCYSNAAKLGNQIGNQRLAAINAIYGNKFKTNGEVSGSFNNSTSGRSTTKCGHCKGTGKIAGYVATYGLGKSYWCDFCNKEVPGSHCCQCKTCPFCNGKGFR